ncbi:hypothetical protein IWZ01DRAFT_20790 [Phyllosticta capitalensis]|uniref:Secreted protein n=1 Tax=Phyllosticta capitalensis TaxID=121624 RepID=A0ABR1Z446_9PEZI
MGLLGGSRALLVPGPLRLCLAASCRLCSLLSFLGSSCVVSLSQVIQACVASRARDGFHVCSASSLLCSPTYNPTIVPGTFHTLPCRLGTTQPTVPSCTKHLSRENSNKKRLQLWLKQFTSRFKLLNVVEMEMRPERRRCNQRASASTTSEGSHRAETAEMMVDFGNRPRQMRSNSKRTLIGRPLPATDDDGIQ